MHYLLTKLKWLIAPQEMAALNRYRLACAEVSRWNASIKPSAMSAAWIITVGEGLRGMDIEQHRAEVIREMKNGT